MTIIPAKDAAVLAYLARHKNTNQVRAKKMKAGLQGQALQVAKALTGSRSDRVASRAARGLRSWARDNEKIVRVTVFRKSSPLNTESKEE